MASLIDGVAVRGKLIVVGVANDPMPVSTLSLDSEVLVGPRDWDPKAGSGTEKETRALGLREYPHRSHPTHAVRGDCVFTNIGILLWPWRA
jgi:hypothetical protein